MTNERAIELLHRISDSQFDGIHGDERREALEMAVRALFSQQTVNDSQGLVNDCISRNMAIDAFEPTHYIDWYTPTIIETLEALPFVKPEPHWIPCSERLPEEDEDVLVCSEDGDIDIAFWMPEQWTNEPHIEWWSGEYRVFAVAWMPLPKPYGGESE